MIRTKRVYDPPSPDDGLRLLVMRLWPRGVSKAAVDGWEPGLGPSRQLLQAYRRGGMEWHEFARRYREEMAGQGELLARYRERGQRETLTLLCGCADESRCHRGLLKGLIERDPWGRPSGLPPTGDRMVVPTFPVRGAEPSSVAARTNRAATDPCSRAC